MLRQISDRAGKFVVMLGLAIGSVNYAAAQVNVSVTFLSYPDLVQVPGYPVYYAPQVSANYFFYDGLYWVLHDDGWYSSYWYNGPWQFAEPANVPLFILRVPVRYYVRPPVYFGAWQSSEPPRWGQHWGSDWESRRRGWDRWDHRTMQAPAPLPSYQSQYSGNRYPQGEERQLLQEKNYHYQPHEALSTQMAARLAHAKPPAPATRNPNVPTLTNTVPRAEPAGVRAGDVNRATVQISIPNAAIAPATNKLPTEVRLGAQTQQLPQKQRDQVGNVEQQRRLQTRQTDQMKQKQNQQIQQNAMTERIDNQRAQQSQQLDQIKQQQQRQMEQMRQPQQSPQQRPQIQQNNPPVQFQNQPAQRIAPQ